MTNSPATDAAIITLGEEFGRRGSKRPVAISKVFITLQNASDAKACIEALQASDAQLAAKPPSDRMYDWQLAVLYGNQIAFGVAWYDTSFFAAKKDVYLGVHHNRIFERFGVSPETVSVQHFVSER